MLTLSGFVAARPYDTHVSLITHTGETRDLSQKFCRHIIALLQITRAKYVNTVRPRYSDLRYSDNPVILAEQMFP